MQNSFSFSRLWLLVKKQLFDNARLYTLSLLALTGVLSLVFLCWAFFNESHRYDAEDTYVIFLLFLFPVGFIFASATFQALGDKAKGVYWLTVPATHTEKLVTGIIYSVIIFLVLYTGIFVVIQRITFFLITLNPANNIRWSSGFWREIRIAAIFFVALQSAFILGSVYFQKYAFVKTVLALMAIGVAYALLTHFAVRNLFPDHLHIHGLSSVRTWDGDDSRIYRLAPWTEQALELVLKYIWAPVLLAATYFRLREKEL